MRKLTLILALLIGAALVPQLSAADKAADGKIRVLLVTGGHGFERPQFLKVFEDNPQITFEAVEHPNPKDKNPPPDPVYAKLRPDAVKAYDVVVLYDMWQKITDEAKADFVAMLNQGKGLVVLHHAIANYQDWPEYHKIFGARYYLKPTMVDGAEKPRSQWKHDVKFKVHIADPKHPIARGLKDFEIHDETYKGYDVRPEVKPLLTTDEPLSSPTIGWTKTYEKARVVYIQLGHDHFAYENPNFQKLVAHAIAWAAGKK